MRTVLASLVLIAACGFATNAQEKDKPKVKGQLPAGWKALNLSKAQIEHVYTIQTDYRFKVMALEKQIADLKAAEKADMVKVLTPDQKTALTKILTGETPKAKETEKK